jgi:hypothetical protein
MFRHVKVVAMLMFAGSAVYAETVPFTRAIVSTNNPSESVTPQQIHSAPASASAASYANSGTWGSVAGSASADLTAGQLKVRATNNPAAGSYPYIQTNAWFGDGFRTSTPNGPFSWTPQSTARFTLDLTGSSVTSSNALGELNAGAFVILSLYQPGTLSSTSKLVGGSNNIAYYLYMLGNPNQQLYYTDDNGQTLPLTPTGGYTDLSHDIHIEKDFQPNGDFDWAVLIGAAGQVGGPQYFDIDLSHTLTLNYSGPAGTTTSADSGLFNNFTPIPEPTGVLVIGMGGLLITRRRKLAR